MGSLLAFSLLPALSLIVAGLLAVWRAPGARLQSAVMHIAGGVVFAVVAMELLPDLVHEKSVIVSVLGFALGTAAMLGLRWLTRSAVAEKAETKSTSQSNWSGILFGTSVDLAVDGLMLGVGFAAGAKAGSLLGLALTLEVIALGVAVVVALKPTPGERLRSVLILLGLALVFVVSTGLGRLVLSLLSGAALAGILAFGAAALLFLVTEELLTEAHVVEESPGLTSTFFAGFLAIMMLELLVQ